MLQELTYGRLENEFYNRKPEENDLVICVKKNQILLPHPIRCEENTGNWIHIDTRSDGFRAITWFKG